MSVTCIVCLGDLGESASDPLAFAAEAVPRLNHGADANGGGLPVNSLVNPDVLDGSEDPGQIARLLPCSHILHNNCLKPWVERANSCPICRRSFNVVEIIDHPEGPVLSSYTVEDRIQVADVDPSMILDYIDDDPADVQPCPICGDADNEEVLLLCDGCDMAWHTYCTGLDTVPSGPWYCEQCQIQHAIGSTSDSPSRVSRAPEGRGRRTRAQQRRQQNRNQMNSVHWAHVWQFVRDRLDFDLEFPFSHDSSTDRLDQQLRRDAANEREFRAWQRRFEVADRQGGNGIRLRDTAALLDIEAPRPSRPRVPRAPTPEPESLEEMRAWNAFERAREIENDPSAARKRKEPTLSPSPEPTEPERKLKRPRTRRPQELAALATQNGESSRTTSVQTSARINAESSSEPSFLQSLLREVEEASIPSRTNSYGPSGQTSNSPTDHNYSPGPSSPSISPSPSNNSSPRLSSTTPPPHARGRPISPIQLTPSSAPSSPPFSPDVSPSAACRFQNGREDNNSNNNNHGTCSSTPRPRMTQLQIPRRSFQSDEMRGKEGSPTRPGLSLVVKSGIQKLVGTALKPYYRTKVVSKDEYTDINRTISRKLYERVGDGETLEEDTRTRLEHAANEEVRKAVEHVKQKKSGFSSDTENSS